MIFSLPFLFLTELSVITFNTLLLLYLKTILGTLAFWCVMLAIKNMEISKALPLMVLTPGLVALSAFAFLGESLTTFEIFGMLLLLAGTYILESKAKQDILMPFKIFIRSKNHHYIIFALLLFTATSVLDKTLLSRFSLKPPAFIGFQHIFMAFNFSLIILMTSRSPANILRSVPSDLWLWIIFISLLTIGYRFSQIESFKDAPVALVLTIKRTSVFFAAIIGGKIFKEKKLLLKAAATIIMIAGAILVITK
jgi:drug/metabolite transporter (DMT)-like permease